VEFELKRCSLTVDFFIAAVNAVALAILNETTTNALEDGFALEIIVITSAFRCNAQYRSCQTHLHTGQLMKDTKLEKDRK